MYILLLEKRRLGIIKEIQNRDNTRIAVCSYDEQEEFYIDALEVPREDLSELNNLNKRRKQEILTSRYLLQHLLGKSIWAKFKKDSYGKPYIEGSELYISLSHSYDRSAAIISERRVGIDLQKYVEKIERIKEKFLNPIELQSINDRQKKARLHLYWGAKECMYKSYGKKEVNFKAHLFVDYIDSLSDKGSFLAKMEKDDFNTHYTMYYEKHDEYFLVYGIPDGDTEL